MTTQELKQYIDRVLGNNIRCLLPSYWWKRLFNQVADRIEDVEQSTSQLIDSKVEEAKMPIVGSVDELENLELAKGRVAAVEKVGEPVIVNYEDCYMSSDNVNDWDKYTIVKGVSEIGEIPLDAEEGEIFLIADKYDLEADTIVIGIEDGRRAYGKIRGGFYYLTLDKANEYLASGRYRLIGGYRSDRIAQYFTFYSAFPQPSLYIKGDSWERLAKESDLEGIEGGGDDVNEKIEDAVGAVVFYVDTNGGQLDDEYIAANAEQYKRLRKSDGMLANRPVYVKNYDGFLIAQMVVIDAYKKVGLIFETYEGRRLSVTIFPNGTYSDIADASSSSGVEIREFYTGDSLTDEQKAWNLETMEMVQQSKCIVLHKFTKAVGIFPANTTAYLSYVLENSFGFLLGVGVNSARAVINVASDGTASVTYTASVFTVDSSLSETSTNPVQNKVVTKAIGILEEHLAVHSKQISSLGLSMATKTDVDNAIANAITTTLNTAV